MTNTDDSVIKKVNDLAEWLSLIRKEIIDDFSDVRLVIIRREYSRSADGFNIVERHRCSCAYAPWELQQFIEGINDDIDFAILPKSSSTHIFKTYTSRKSILTNIRKNNGRLVRK